VCPNYKAQAQDDGKTEPAEAKHANARARLVEISTGGATGNHLQIYISTLFWASYVADRNHKLQLIDK